ncbi:hypothetical protein, partial [Anaerobranca gottschalkii]
MIKIDHFSLVILYNITMRKINCYSNEFYYNQFFEKGQQEINFDLYQIGLPSDDPVYTLKKVMEEMDFSSLIANYSNKGR